MGSALDAIRARMAAEKAAKATAPNTTTAAPETSSKEETPEVSPTSTPAVDTPGVASSSPAQEPLCGAAPDPLAGLSGIQLLLARKKLAESAGKQLAGSANRSAGSHTGSVSGTGSSMVTEVSRPQLGQNVITPAQRALEEAKKLLQSKEATGFYNVPTGNEPKLPEDLPAQVVKERLQELDAALVLKTPDLARLTIEINRNLRQYDELAYLLSDPQLGLIVQANLTIKNTELIATKTKASSAKSSAEKLGKLLTADDI